jgi:hypothetical protein
MEVNVPLRACEPRLGAPRPAGQHEQLELEVGPDVVRGDELRDLAVGEALDGLDEARLHGLLEGAAGLLHVSDDLAVCLMRGGFTRVEQKLIGREVVGFMSGSQATRT